MRRLKNFIPVILSVAALCAPSRSQTLAVDDAVLRGIWTETMENSMLEPLAHELLDVIGPRLVGTPQMKKAHDWAAAKYQSWGVSAENEAWGKWRGWRRGVTHIDLVQPRVRTLAGMMLAWSPGTKKKGVTAEVVILADAADSLAFQAWLPHVKDKFVLTSMPQPTGRPNSSWEEFGLEASFEKMKEGRNKLQDHWAKRLKKTGFNRKTIQKALEEAGAAGIISSFWARGWGANRIFGASTENIPVIDLSLEDYGLVYRLAESGHNPTIRLVAESKFLGEVPAFNTLARIPGTEKPDEYVMLSAHFDSWDGASGATDNGTGTLTMMEAMRVLKKVYPKPKRTILVGHWGSEEQGLNGSRAFVKDHPEIVDNLQALFNQDNGTGRVENISGSGFINAGAFFGKWLARLPNEVTQHIKLRIPGMPSRGGSDHAAFVAAGAPAFFLRSLNWGYFSYTWHTNLDTYDKIVFDDVRNNAVLAASLAYLASEEPEKFSRERREMPIDEKTGEPRAWPAVKDGNRAGRLENR